MNLLSLWQLLTVISVPMLGIFLGILLNQRSADKLSNEIKDIRKELLDFRKQMHDGYVGLLNMIGDHGQRIVRLEERGTSST